MVFIDQKCADLYSGASRISLTLMRATSLKTYKGFPHGMPTTEAATINEDLLAFLRK
jgi:non-heme chloroperoxidase